MNLSFEGEGWRDTFTDIYRDNRASREENAAIDGSWALNVDIPQNEHYGMDATYDPQAALDETWEQIQVEYWVRFTDDFQADGNASKLPGPRNREDGRAGDGPEPGWTVRGSFRNPEGDSGIGVGYYVYHLDQDSGYGDYMHATDVSTGEWHRITEYVELNTISDGSANDDGVLKMWVDGDLHIDRTSMRFTADENRLHTPFEFTVYFGGNDPSPQDQAVKLDGLTVTDDELSSGEGPAGNIDDGDDTGDGDDSITGGSGSPSFEEIDVGFDDIPEDLEPPAPTITVDAYATKETIRQLNALRDRDEPFDVAIGEFTREDMGITDLTWEYVGNRSGYDVTVTLQEHREVYVAGGDPGGGEQQDGQEADEDAVEYIEDPDQFDQIPDPDTENTVNLYDQGLREGDEIDPYLGEHLESGTRVEVPGGQYQWNGGGLGGAYEDASLVGIEPQSGGGGGGQMPDIPSDATNLGDEGLTDGDDIAPYLSNTSNGETVVIPNGSYNFSGTSVSANDWTIVAPDGATFNVSGTPTLDLGGDGWEFAGVRFDQSGSGAGMIVDPSGNGWHLHNCAWDGEHPGDTYLLTPRVDSNGGEAEISHIYSGEGKVPDTMRGFMWLNNGHNGELWVRDSSFVNCGHLYAIHSSEPLDGTCHFERCYGKNLAHNVFRTGHPSEATYVRDCVIDVNESETDPHGTSGSSSRGVWAWWGTTRIQNTDINYPGGRAVVENDRTNGDARLYDSQVNGNLHGNVQTNNVGSNPDTTPPASAPTSPSEAISFGDTSTQTQTQGIGIQSHSEGGGHIELDATNADPADIRVTGGGAGSFHMEHVIIRGNPTDDANAMLNVSVTDANASALLRRVWLPEGAANGTSSGIRIANDNAGTVYLRNSSVEDFPNGGVMARNGGDVVIEGGLYRNNNIADIAFGSNGSKAELVTVVNDEDAPAYRGGDTNQRGIWFTGGDGTLVTDCDFYHGVNSGTAIKADEGNITGRVENSRITNDSSRPAAIIRSDVTFDGVHLTGSGQLDIQGAQAAAVGDGADRADYSTDANNEQVEMEEEVLDPGETRTIEVSDNETLEGTVYDQSADGASVQIAAHGSSWTVRNIAIIGTAGPNAPRSTVFATVDPGSTATIENLYLPDGGPGNENMTGIHVGESHAGQLSIRTCNIQQYPDLGIRAHDPGADTGNGGSVEVDTCYTAYNGGANISLGVNGSQVVNSVVYGDGTGPSRSGDYRGVWGWYQDTDVSESDVFMADEAGAALVGGRHGGRLRMTNGHLRGSAAGSVDTSNVGGDPDSTPPSSVPTSPVQAADTNN